MSVMAPKQDAAYYGYRRSFPIRTYLPKPVGAVLDIGCGRGGAGEELRAAGATRIVGIELVEAEARHAAERYDRVLTGSAETLVDTLDERFDTVLCYDVLEHLVDPWHVLRRARALINDGGHIHVSLPNVQYVGLARDIWLRGTFGYTDAGHRDRTHLRWFTRRDIEQALRDTGWEPVGAGHMPLEGRRGRLNRLLGGKLTPYLIEQWMVLARPAGG